MRNLLLLLILILNLPAVAQDLVNKHVPPAANLRIRDQAGAFTINNVFTYHVNNGSADYNLFTGNSGFEFPKGSGKTCVYESGLIWVGNHMGWPEFKAGGSMYRHALQAGKIITPGTTQTTGTTPNCVSDDPTLAKHRVYRVRPDVNPGVTFQTVEATLTEEANLIGRNDRSATAQSLYNQYLLDWEEWPARGSVTDPSGLAPFADLNGNGMYEPGTDIPGQPGADQTLYYVANDNNSSLTQNLAYTPPIGLEFHRTIWGYKAPAFLANCVFTRNVLINKSGWPVNNFQCGMWCDIDLGDSGDDRIGSDSTIGLAYAYNGDDYDATYGAAPPAVGVLLLAGPAVPGLPTDSALCGSTYRRGMRNLPPFAAWGENFQYPPYYEDFESSIQIYRRLNGLQRTTGIMPTDPWGIPLRFHFSGDPLTLSGWLDTQTPGDRRNSLSTAPLNFANGDTIECAYAMVVGQGANRLTSIPVLKLLCRQIRSNYPRIVNGNSFPAAPSFRLAGDDRSVHILWGEDQKAADRIEHASSFSYQFEGYNIYQIDSVTGAQARVATLDLQNSVTTVFDEIIDESTSYPISAPVFFGTDSGLRRHFTVATDALRKGPILNWRVAAFAVTAYAVARDPLTFPHALESPRVFLTVLPQPPEPGTRVGVVAGDTISNVVHSTIAGISSGGTVVPVVLDPSALTGHTYRVSFHGSGPTLNWNLLDLTTQETKAADQSDQSGSYASPMVDGIQFYVIDGPDGHRNTTADRFDIVTPSSQAQAPAALEADVKRITVYPNPYISSNPEETNRHIRFVTIARLPQRATIRIFALNGDLVRTFVKDDDQQIVRWDLLNEAQYTVGPGMYIIHIALPDAGVTKILKLAVISRIDIPDHL